MLWRLGFTHEDPGQTVGMDFWIENRGLSRPGVLELYGILELNPEERKDDSRRTWGVEKRNWMLCRFKRYGALPVSYEGLPKMVARGPVRGMEVLVTPMSS
jgi:hypothetical protein